MDVPDYSKPGDVLSSPDSTALSDLLTILHRPLRPRAASVGTATLVPAPGEAEQEV